MLVIVQDDVAVPAIELPVRGGIHRHLLGAFNSPDLGERSRAAARALCRPRYPQIPARSCRALCRDLRDNSRPLRLLLPSAARSLFGAFLHSQTSAGTAVGFWTALSPFSPPASMLKVMSTGCFKKWHSIGDGRIPRRKRRNKSMPTVLCQNQPHFSAELSRPCCYFWCQKFPQ